MTIFSYFFASTLRLFSLHNACYATVSKVGMTVTTAYFYLFSSALHTFSSHCACCAADIRVVDGVVDGATTTSLFF